MQLHGRAIECAAIDRLLDDARHSVSGVLVLRADAGIGKSALLEFARLRGADLRILQTIGVEPEAELPYAALHRLLRPVVAFIDRIPEVQAAALRGALAIAPGDAENRFVIAVAVLSVLAEVASDGPILCLIDDAHWLDSPSADALSFVGRRLEAEGIAMLFAARQGDVRTFSGAGLADLTVCGLDDVEAEQLLVERFGAMISTETRRAIGDAAQGNPLALLEIPGALTAEQLSGRAPLPQPMPLGHDLERILLERVRRLPGAAQTLLLVAAAEGSGQADIVVDAAARLGVSPQCIEDIEAAGLVHTEASTIVFRHPVLRTAVYQGAGLPQRRAAHRALAEVLHGEGDEDRRTWHRAALVLRPDDVIADQLEQMADRARKRGGHAAAYGALRRAAELTPSTHVRARRLASAARAAWDAGRPDEASALLRMIDTSADAETYAEMRHLQGEIELRCGIPLDGATLLIEGATRVADSDPHKALLMLLDAAMCANYAGNSALMLEVGRMASALTFEDSQPEAPLANLIEAVVGRMLEQHTIARERLVSWLDQVADPAAEPRWLIWAAAAASGIGDQARQDALRRRAEVIARDSMAVGTLAMVLELIAWTDMMYGRASAAAMHSEEGLKLAVETGMTNSACFHRAILAWAAAVRGDEATCQLHAGRASATASEHGLGPHGSIARWAIGLLHLGRGQWQDATNQLAALSSPASGAGHPYVALQAIPDLVEAAVRADEPEIAQTASLRFEAFAARSSCDWEKALADRCTALVGSIDTKEELLLRALDRHDEERQFSRSRTQLLLGEHLRRERRPTDARAHLRGALETFAALGATPWEARATAELRATGERARKREPNTLAQLTPQQHQIMRLVSEGATNKMVAAQLFLSPRTVDYHLRNVFLKLGISSRADLIRLHASSSSAG